MLTLRKTQPGVTQRAANYKKHNYKKHVRLNKEKTLQVSERALQKWSPQKCQTLTADADRGREQHWHLNTVKCPTRRTAKARKANAPTAAEMSRKMERVGPQQEARRLRLRPRTSARVVRHRTDGEVWWCCLPATGRSVLSVRLWHAPLLSTLSHFHLCVIRAKLHLTKLHQPFISPARIGNARSQAL